MLAHTRCRTGIDPVRASLLSRTRCLKAFAIRACGLLVVIGGWVILSCSSDVAAADQPSVMPSERPRPSLFRLPDILKRGDKPTSPVHTVPGDRFVARSRQLLADARQLERNGHPEAAMELARRAESIITTAQHTTGVNWPQGEDSPTDYIAELHRRFPPSNEASTPSGVTTVMDDDRTSSSGQPQLLPKTAASSATSVTALSIGSEARVAQSIDTATANRNQTGTLVSDSGAGRVDTPPEQRTVLPELLLDWGNRTPSEEIKLTGSVRDQTSSDAEMPGTAQSDNAQDQIAQDESGLLLQQLGRLEEWTSIQVDPSRRQSDADTQPTSSSPPSNEVPQPLFEGPLTAIDTGPATMPSVIPELIPRSTEIDDRNVGPIPTQVPLTGNSQSRDPSATTIPVVPHRAGRNSSRPLSNEPTTDELAASIHDRTPWLLPGQKPDAASSSDTNSTEPAPVIASGSNSNLWQLAAVQVFATFLGVLLAIAAFLAIRAVAARLFGTALGVTVQVGGNPISTVQQQKIAADGNTYYVNESSDVVWLGGVSNRTSSPLPANSEDQPSRAGGVANAEDFPFRIVGASGDDEHLLEEQECEEAILKSVFDHNINLMNQLNGLKESAA
ncbi:MAG: hypothetical protein O3B13_20655 [Planctomycetota bacterium]|nr:hypothetical protein [Planctomycetota bacterium]